MDGHLRFIPDTTYKNIWEPNWTMPADTTPIDGQKIGHPPYVRGPDLPNNVQLIEDDQGWLYIIDQEQNPQNPQQWVLVKRAFHLSLNPVYLYQLRGVVKGLTHETMDAMRSGNPLWVGSPPGPSAAPQ
jgi:hypothetical protein